MSGEERFHGRLSGAQARRLCEALLQAFPTREALREFVWFELEQNLEEIAPMGADLRAVVGSLVRWAESQEKLDRLLSRAKAANPGNQSLATVVEGLVSERGQGGEVVAPPQDSSGVSIEYYVLQTCVLLVLGFGVGFFLEVDKGHQVSVFLLMVLAMAGVGWWLVTRYTRRLRRAGVIAAGTGATLGRILAPVEARGEVVLSLPLFKGGGATASAIIVVVGSLALGVWVRRGRPRSPVSPLSDETVIPTPVDAPEGGGGEGAADAGPVDVAIATPQDAGRRRHRPLEEVCRGRLSDPQGVERVIQAARPSLEHCYRLALRNNPTFGGRMEVDVDVTVRGSIQAVRVARSNPEFERCVRSRLRPLSVPRALGSCATFRTPFYFSPGGG